MDCEGIRHLLNELAEGLLQEPDRQMAEEHLKGCPSCQRKLAAACRTIRVLKEFGQVNEPPDFLQQVRRRIETRENRRILGTWLPRPSARVLATAGCLILIAVGAWLAYRQWILPPERVASHPTRKADEPSVIALARSYDSILPPEPGEKQKALRGKDVDSDGLAHAGESGRRSDSDSYGLGRGALQRAPENQVENEIQEHRLTWGNGIVWDTREAVHAKTSPARAKELAEGEKLRRAEEVSVEEGRFAEKTAPAVRTQILGKAHADFSEAKTPGTPSPGDVGLPEPAKPREALSATQGIDKRVVRESEVLAGDASVSKLSPEEEAEEGTLTADTEGGRYGGERLEKATAGMSFDDFAPQAVGKFQQKKEAVTSLKDGGFDYAATLEAPVKEDVTVQEQAGRYLAIQDESGAVNGTLLASYYARGGGGIPVLTINVKNRENALTELKKEVASLGGTIEPLEEQRRRGSGESRTSVPDILIVHLKQSAFPSFVKKYRSHSWSRDLSVAGTGASGFQVPADAPRGPAGEPDSTTLFIRLVEIQPQDPVPQATTK
jgi:hypothetical protein